MPTAAQRYSPLAASFGTNGKTSCIPVVTSMQLRVACGLKNSELGARFRPDKGTQIVFFGGMKTAHKLEVVKQLPNLLSKRVLSNRSYRKCQIDRENVLSVK